MKISVSVIVPFLNEEKYIARCVESLLRQDFKENYEVILVDNGSTDQSVKIVSRYLINNKTKLLFESEKNVYAARNKGLGVAQGDILAFTDADCVVSNTWLKKAINIFLNKDTVIILGKRKLPNNSFGLKVVEDYENTKIEYVLENLHKDYWFGFTNNMFVRKSLLKNLGGFKLLHTEGDTEMVQRYAQNSDTDRPKGVMYCNKLVIEHLEVTALKIWLGKMHLYGKQNESLGELYSFLHLDFRQQLKIFGIQITKCSYSLMETLGAIGILGVVNVCYKIGLWKARFRRRYL